MKSLETKSSTDTSYLEVSFSSSLNFGCNTAFDIIYALPGSLPLPYSLPLS